MENQITDQVIQLEHAMWEAALHQDVNAFKKLVSPHAVMICGGGRCLGSEYADFIQDFFISGYTISHMEVIHCTADEVVLHYVNKIEVEDSRAKDLEGLFHVASIWKRNGGAWNLIFNMDSRIIEL